MKSNKIVTIISILLLTVVIIIASFFGIYKLKEYKVVNIVPNFLLGMEFNDRRVVNFDVDTSIETKIYDQDGNLVEEEEGIEYTKESGYNIVEEKVNSEEVLNKENYKKSQKILEKRLKVASVGEYIIRKDDNGNFEIEIPENDKTDEIVSSLAQRGEFTIVDEETEELLLDNSNIKDVKIAYGQNTTGTTVYMQLEFDKEGSKKLNEMSKVYIETTSQEENEDGELEEVTTKKNIVMLLDGETYGKTYFGEEITNGVLNLTVGTSSGTQELQEYIYDATLLANIIKTGKNPIAYNITQEVKEKDLNMDCLKTTLYVLGGIFGVALIYLVIKFRLQGLMGAIMEIGYIALVLLILRYVNITITVSGIIGIVVSFIISYILVYEILLESNRINKFIIRCIPIYILSIILSFSSNLNMASMGMTLLWGIITMYVYHLICTKTIIKLTDK